MILSRHRERHTRLAEKTKVSRAVVSPKIFLGNGQFYGETEQNLKLLVFPKFGSLRLF